METRGPGLNNMKPQSLQLVLEDQVLALQQQMAENQAASWRKLKSSQEAQQRQAVLVRKLQAKVRPLPFQGGEREEHPGLGDEVGYGLQMAEPSGRNVPNSLSDAHNYSMSYILSPFYLFIIIFNLDLRIFFLFIFREREWRGERETSCERLVDSHTHPN